MKALILALVMSVVPVGKPCCPPKAKPAVSKCCRCCDCKKCTCQKKKLRKTRKSCCPKNVKCK